MGTAIDCEWLDTRIARTKELIVVYEDAIEKLTTGHQSYTLDTGQTRQTVERGDLGKLNEVLSSLENRLATLSARRHGASHHAKPGW